mgnify:CR=1 FL=1
MNYKKILLLILCPLLFIGCTSYKQAVYLRGDDTAAIKAAREAFDKLTQAQQDLVDMRVLANNGKSGLDGMINYYDELRLAEDGDLIVEKMIREIMDKFGEALPARLTLAEQGSFQLGYYHQNIALYQKKEDQENV